VFLEKLYESRLAERELQAQFLWFGENVSFEGSLRFHKVGNVETKSGWMRCRIVDEWRET
jgi:hypothetical protein